MDVAVSLDVKMCSQIQDAKRAVLLRIEVPRNLIALLGAFALLVHLCYRISVTMGFMRCAATLLSSPSLIYSMIILKIQVTAHVRI
jgi:hypothetical protein